LQKADCALVDASDASDQARALDATTPTGAILGRHNPACDAKSLAIDEPAERLAQAAADRSRMPASSSLKGERLAHSRSGDMRSFRRARIAPAWTLLGAFGKKVPGKIDGGTAADAPAVAR
jgi:hypothetical protein